MLIIYGLLVFIIVLQVLNLFKRSNDSLTGKIDILPELVKEKIANAILENNQKLLNEISTVSQLIQSDFTKLQLEILQRLNVNSESLITVFTQLSSEMRNALNMDVNRLIEMVRLELERINAKVESKLKEGFTQTNETFNNILIRLTKIDEAQKKIDELSGEIISLQNVLTDKKTRGIFGEVQLNQILIAAFGENNKKLYATQYKFNTGSVVDAILFAPEPVGKIAIDSKFPLENYQRMVDVKLALADREMMKRDFETNIKKHIDDIASKYIIAGESSSQAIMFIPAEAIFAHIHAYHGNLLDYAQRQKVWLASPTTLMAMLTTIQVVVKNMEQALHARVIQHNLHILSEEFSRYKTRWDSLAKHIDTVSKDVKEIHTTTAKIGNKFESIARVELSEELPPQ
ncbi:MAG: DNA recombination protein RmuC [Burkholderiales bacterium]|nr:DNA recombination protein RmuC [Burkholderiales bacterium]